MSGFLSRWYSEATFSEIDYNSAEAVWSNAGDNNKNVDLPSDTWLTPTILSAAAAVSQLPRSYYQVIVRKPIAEVGTPFDPEKFKDPVFLNQLKESAAKILADNLIGSQDDAALVILKNNAYVPYNFHIDPGKASSGSLIYFQVLFSLGASEKADLPTITEGPPSDVALEEEGEAATGGSALATAPGASTVKYNGFEFMDLTNDQNTLRKITKALEALEVKNRNLAEKWNFSFLGLAAEIKNLVNYLNETVYGTYGPPLVRQTLWDKYDEANPDAPGASQSTMAPLEQIEFSFKTTFPSRFCTQYPAIENQKYSDSSYMILRYKMEIENLSRKDILL